MSDRLREIISAYSVSERLDSVEMAMARTFTTTDALAHVDAIFGALADLPGRDRFALTLEVADDAREVGDLNKVEELREHIRKFHEEGEPIRIRIEILKGTVEQRLSVYSPEALGEYLATVPLFDAIFALSTRFRNRLVFECFSGSPGKGSATLSFIKAGEAAPDESISLAYRDRALALLQENAFRRDDMGSLVPQDFAVTDPIGVAALDAFMARAGAVLSAMFLSNFSELAGDKLTYRIAGYKLLAGTVDRVADLVDESATLQKVAHWAYGPEGNSDKVGLARNVLSLCVQRLEDVPAHPEIWDAIQSNYQIYLKENITTYLEARNKIAELLAESMHKTHALVEGLLDSIRNGVLVVLTFLLTVVVVNGLKDTGVQVIFSIEYVAIAVALLVLSSVAIWASCRDARSRFEQGSTATADLLRRMYAHVMIPAEIAREVDPTIEAGHAYIERQTTKYQRFWFAFALLVALAFLGGYLAFGEARTSPDPISGASAADAPLLREDALVGPATQVPAAEPRSTSPSTTFPFNEGTGQSTAAEVVPKQEQTEVLHNPMAPDTVGKNEVRDGREETSEKASP